MTNLPEVLTAAEAEEIYADRDKMMEFEPPARRVITMATVLAEHLGPDHRVKILSPVNDSIKIWVSLNKRWISIAETPIPRPSWVILDHDGYPARWVAQVGGMELTAVVEAYLQNRIREEDEGT